MIPLIIGVIALIIFGGLFTMWLNDMLRKVGIPGIPGIPGLP